MNRVFVYGTLRKGFSNYDYYLTDSGYAGEDEIVGYKMISMGSFPGIFYTGNINDIVHIEIYDVSDKTLKNLDILEGIPRLYKRFKIKSAAGNTGFIYTISNEKIIDNCPVIKNGDWKKYTMNTDRRNYGNC